jgi:hypothetical protein
MSKNFAQYNWSDLIQDVVSQPSFVDAKVSSQYETKQEVRIRKINKIFNKIKKPLKFERFFIYVVSVFRIN